MLRTIWDSWKRASDEAFHCSCNAFSQNCNCRKLQRPAQRHGTWTEYFKIFQVRPCLPVEGEVFAHFREHPRSKGNITSRRSLDLDRLGMLISSSCLFDLVAHELVENNWSGSFLYVVVFWSTSRVTCETLGHSRKGMESMNIRKVFRKHPTWIVGNALQKTSNLDVTGLEGIPCHALPSYIRYM